MPIYEYACRQCGHHLEARQKFSDPPLTLCPQCQNESLERLISNSSFALKGGGWYADGYGPESKKTESSSTKDASKTDTDTKPSETKSDKESAKSSDSSKSTDKSA